MLAFSWQRFVQYALCNTVYNQKNNEETLTLFSVWAKSGYDNYHVPILNSLKYFYEKTNSPIVLVGDFNTGSQYNNIKNNQYYKFIKNELKTKYLLENCAFKQEWLPTYRNDKNEFFLDDHCFFELPQCVLSFNIGDWSHWTKYSDHIPIISDINDTSSKQNDPGHTLLKGNVLKGMRELQKSKGWQQLTNQIDKQLMEDHDVKIQS